MFVNRTVMWDVIVAGNVGAPPQYSPYARSQTAFHTSSGMSALSPSWLLSTKSMTSEYSVAVSPHLCQVNVVFVGSFSHARKSSRRNNSSAFITRPTVLF